MKYTKLIATLTLSLCAGQLFAGDYSKESAHEQMAKMMTLTQPTQNHALLKDLTGKWKATSKFWMDANAKPEQSAASMTGKLIMDGRFLQTDFKGTAMGKPFNGMGIMGFDNIKGQYQSIWIDNMSTSMMVSTGTYDAATKTITENGTSSCPMTGDKDRAFRGEWKLQDKNNFQYVMYSNGTDGKEYKMMEITYKRG